MTTRHTGRWLDGHEDDDHDVPGNGDALWERPREPATARFVPRVGVSGTVRDTTLAFVIHLVTWYVSIGRAPLVIATDATDNGGWESAAALRLALSGVLDGARIVGLIIESAESAGANVVLNAVATELLTRYPDANMLLFTGSAQRAVLPLDPELAHYTVGVLDACSQMDATVHSLTVATDLLVIHQPSSAATAHDQRESREIVGRVSGLPAVFADCTSGQGLDNVFAVLWNDVFDA